MPERGRIKTAAVDGMQMAPRPQAIQLRPRHTTASSRQTHHPPVLPPQTQTTNYNYTIQETACRQAAKIYVLFKHSFLFIFYFVNPRRIESSIKTM